MARKNKNHSKENIVKEENDVKHQCIDCSTEYQAVKATYYKNGDIVISPPRCERCQVTHLLGLRVDKVLDGLKHIGNLKNRIDKQFPTGCQATLNVLDSAMDTLRDRFSQTSIKTVKTGFNVAKAVKELQ